MLIFNLRVQQILPLKLAPGESVDLYYNFQMPSKAHFIESNLLFYQADNYQENRRFGLWLEGLILGSILGLLVFTIYSYYQIRDKTTLYFWSLASEFHYFCNWSISS